MTLLRNRTLLTLVACAWLSGCATVSVDNNGDPWESTNRSIFAFNQGADRYAIKPAAEAYRWALPTFVRDRIRGILYNLTEPLVLANDLLQLRMHAAYVTLSRFIINSTVGLGGMFDLAQQDGLSRQSGDFGQTLYTWHVSSGPYLVLPILGPSDVRDGIGTGVDLLANPVAHVGNVDNWNWIVAGMGVVRAIDLRAQNIDTLESLESNSLDFYATMRSIYQQKRRLTLLEARPQPPATDDDLIDPGSGAGQAGTEDHGGAETPDSDHKPASAASPAGKSP